MIFPLGEMQLFPNLTRRMKGNELASFSIYMIGKSFQMGPDFLMKSVLHDFAIGWLQLFEIHISLMKGIFLSWFFH